MVGLSEPEKSGGPRPQILADQLTLQSGGEGQIMPTSLNTTCPPGFSDHPTALRWDSAKARPASLIPQRSNLQKNWR